jgi:hypothetical protein
MRRLGAALMAAAMALTIAGPMAQAGTTFQAVACDEHLVAVTDPGTARVDEDLVLHVRGWQGAYLHVGDPLCAGDAVVVVNFNLDLLSGKGNLWGTIHVDLGAFDGGWHRTFTASFTNPAPLMPDATDIWVGRNVGRGFGDLDGWQIRGEGIERTHLLVESTATVFRPGS